MKWNSGFDRVKEERENLSFFKIFQSADLTSEVMRALPYNFMTKVSEKDFSYKMVIRAQWGSTWKVDISKNPRFYYFEKIGWNQFVSDNVLGQNEFVTFTHKGKMRFDVNIYHQNGKEIIKPRMPPTMASLSGIKKEPGESSGYKVKKEEETCESVGVVVPEVKRKKPEESKSSKKKKRKSKKMVTSMETGETSGSRKRKSKGSRSSKKKMISFNNVGTGLPEFKITIRNSYLSFLAIPKHFEKYLPKESELFMIHHPSGRKSWEVRILISETRAIISKGWTMVGRDYPLLVDQEYTFKLIKPFEILLVPSEKVVPVEI